MQKICYRQDFFVILHVKYDDCMRHSWLMVISLFICLSCNFKLGDGDDDSGSLVEIQRYDRIESRYLTTGDFSSLQQMSTDYPVETRMLIEDVLKLGRVDEQDINSKLLLFYRDSTLQSIIRDAEEQYASVDDLNAGFSKAFANLRSWLPDLQIPVIYAQICALDQSIIVGDGIVAISLDKYLGSDYPLYKKFYSDEQRLTMTRDDIIPDALCFYLLSKHHLSNFDARPQIDRDLHVGKIHWVVNKAIEKNHFHSDYVKMIEDYMTQKQDLTISELMSLTDYSIFQ